MDDVSILAYLEGNSGGKTVVEILRGMGQDYELEKKKSLNATLYKMAREGMIHMEQPMPNRKPKWSHQKHAQSQ